MAEAEDYDALAGAQGKLVVFIASLLARAGVAEQSEFASLLATYAQCVSETDPAEGRLLSGWADGVSGTARSPN